VFTALDSARESETKKEIMFELYNEQKQLIGTCEADYSQKRENFKGMAPMKFERAHKVFDEAKTYRICKQENKTVIMYRNVPLSDIIFKEFATDKYVITDEVSSDYIDTAREGT